MSTPCQHCYCQYQGRNGVRHERCCRCLVVVGRGVSFGGPSWNNKPWKTLPVHTVRRYQPMKEART